MRNFGANMLAGRMLACGPLLCADMTLYDSITDSPMQGLPFHPTPMVLGALMWKRWIAWIVQLSIFLLEKYPLLDDPPFPDEGTYDHKSRMK